MGSIMETIQLQTTIGLDGTLHIDAPVALPPGPAEVVIVVSRLARRDAERDNRLQAARELATLNLPVADVDTMNREATPASDELLP
jgi:hypothetical protein